MELISVAACYKAFYCARGDTGKSYQRTATNDLFMRQNLDNCTTCQELNRMMLLNTTCILCVRNEGFEASLELIKFYEAIPDKSAEVHGQVCIIDESGDKIIFIRKISLWKFRFPLMTQTLYLIQHKKCHAT